MIEHASRAESEQGQLIYSGCMQHRTQVQGMVPPEHFVPGCFHRLADALEIGWHPNYSLQLEKEIDSDE